MSAGQGSSISSYDVTARSIPGIICIAAAAPLLPKDIILKIFEVKIPTSTLITSAIAVFLFTFFVGEMIRALSEILESTLLSLVYTLFIRLKYFFVVIYCNGSTSTRCKMNSDKRRDLFLVAAKLVSKAIKKVSVAIEKYLSAFASPSQLFSSKIISYFSRSEMLLSQPDHLFQNRKDKLVVELFEEKMDKENINFEYNTSKIKNVEKDMQSLYPIARSKVFTEKFSLSRRSEMFYIFSRSIYMVLGVFGLVYTLVFSRILFIGYNPIIIFLVSSRIGFVIGLIMLFFSFLFSLSTIKHKKEHIEYLMAEYYNS